MKRLLAIVCVVLFGASVAFAQTGYIGVFGDTEGTSCALAQPGATVKFQLHLVHIGSGGITGVQFVAPKPACLNATWDRDVHVYDTFIGDTQTGLALVYGGDCPAGNFLICSMEFTSQGTTPDCCVYYVLPDPLAASGKYEFADCGYEVITVREGAKAGVVNQTPACSCAAIPAEDSNWGRIKAMYSGE